MFTAQYIAMPKINFYLRNAQTKKKTAIIMFFASHGKRYKLATNQSLSPTNWDDKKQAAKGFAGSSDVNSDLLTLSLKVSNAFKVFIDQGVIPTPDQLKDELKPKEAISDLLLPRYIQFRESSSATRGSQANQKYKALQKHLENFEIYVRKKLKFDQIHSNFFNEFTTYSIIDLKHTNNTIGKHITMFKTFMNWAFESGYHQTTEYKKFKIWREETDIIYLTETELMTLFRHKLKEGSSFEKVRDVFCFGCFTGQRFSDIKGFSYAHVKNGSWFVRTVKTKDPLEIPLNKYAIEIIDKYKERDQNMPVMSNQKTNEYLKGVCELAKIDDPVINIKYRGSERIENALPKHDFITTHTARRTFVTLSLEKGMRPETVMAITGHKDYKTFKRYIKITSKVKEVEMNKIWN